VGIIANPASGKDIRRLVAYGSVFNNTEKINIIKRILMALDAFGVEVVHLMPDYSGLGIQALDDVDISLKAGLLDMEVQGTQEDSTRAAEIMDKLGVACIITLGGDGTNRVVAKSCNHTPLLPISTGTNNVFPFMIEGTLAGIAAGILASERLEIEKVCSRTPRLEVYRGDALLDIALIDLVVTDDAFIGARAVWETDSIKEVFLTRARPVNIGFSALGGYLNPQPANSAQGLHITIGPGNRKVKTPIAPGLICQLPIASHRTIDPGETISISHSPAVIALDGEREISVSDGDRLSVCLNPEGPYIVDIDEVLAGAADRGLFISNQS
jgi:predicted polyphosphate/ATP-dependent NAD kinase